MSGCMSNEPPVVRWKEKGEPREARWCSEADLPPPRTLLLADDRTTAEKALGTLRQGSYLLYGGDYLNARQLLAALGRRLAKKRRDQRPAPSPAEAFRRERGQRAEEHRLLTRLLVPLDAEYRVALRRGVDLRAACEPVWGPPDGRPVVASLRELQGMIGAAQWRERGLEVKGLPGRLHPHYGVFAPTRGEYPALLRKVPAPEGKRVFDVGTGTGVLGLLLLARGARDVVATDIDPRAVACARENAERMGFGARFTALQADLFPPGEADLIVCNAPWIPERPRTALDRAVYDAEGRFLRDFLAGARAHLAPGGEVWLILSDLAERLGLREEGELEKQIESAGLTVRWKQEVVPTHGKASDPEDPLHGARSGEVVRLWCLS
jgi:SAM-dependent methyltransferase